MSTIKSFELFNESFSLAKYDKRLVKQLLTMAGNKIDSDITKKLSDSKNLIFKETKIPMDDIMKSNLAQDLEYFCDLGILVEKMNEDIGFTSYNTWDSYEKIKEFLETDDLQSIYNIYFPKEYSAEDKKAMNKIAMDILTKMKHKENNPDPDDKDYLAIPYFMTKLLKKEYPNHTFDKNVPYPVTIELKNGKKLDAEMLGDSLIHVPGTKYGDIKPNEVKSVKIK